MEVEDFLSSSHPVVAHFPFCEGLDEATSSHARMDNDIEFHARFTDAVTSRARFDDAVLSHARLDDVTLLRTKLEGIILSHARTEDDISCKNWRRRHLFSSKAEEKYLSVSVSVCLSVCPSLNQSSIPTPFYSALVSISVFMALSTVFLFINSPDISPLAHSVLSVSFLLYWSFQLYISLWKSPSALI